MDSACFWRQKWRHGSHVREERPSARDKGHERQRGSREGHARSEAVPVMLAVLCFPLSETRQVGGRWGGFPGRSRHRKPTVMSVECTCWFATVMFRTCAGSRLEVRQSCAVPVDSCFAWNAAERKTIDSSLLRPTFQVKSAVEPWGGAGEYPPKPCRQIDSDRHRQSTPPATDSSKKVPGVIDAVRQLLAATDRNSEYVAGILHGAAHREQLESLRSATDRSMDQAAVWQRPKGGGRQWRASNKAPAQEPSPSAPSVPSAPATARTQQSTGAASSTPTAPPVRTLP